MAPVTQIVQVVLMDISNGLRNQYVHKIVLLESIRIISMLILIFMTPSVNCVSHDVYNATSIVRIVVAVKAQNPHLLMPTQATYSPSTTHGANAGTGAQHLPTQPV